MSQCGRQNKRNEETYITAEVRSDSRDTSSVELMSAVDYELLWEMDSETEACEKCRPGPECSQDGVFQNFCLCTLGKEPHDDLFCQKRLCPGFASHNDPSNAKCSRAYSREEYEKRWLNEKGLAQVIETAVNRGLIDADSNQNILPQLCIIVNTPQGNFYLMESMQSGLHWPYLLMTGTFKTESWWTYCGLSTLTLALNYLDVPPPYYMGIFKWWTEGKVLDLYPQIKEKIDLDPPGTTMDELKCIAADMGLHVTAVTEVGEEKWRCRGCSGEENSKFREVLQSVTLAANYQRQILLVNYHRMLVGQAGSGHWSPIAAYAPLSDMVLIMDVARYKWPPHWVRTDDLIRAMDTADVVGDKREPRGWMLLEKGGTPRRPLCGMIKDPKTKLTEVSAKAGLTDEKVNEMMVASRHQWW